MALEALQTKMNGAVVGLLDAFYAGSLGCSPEDLNAGRLIVVESDVQSIRFAKGSPLALYALAKPSGAVIAVRPGRGLVLKEAVGASIGLDEATCEAIERAVSPHVSVGFWFRGVRLFCDPDSFRDCAAGDVREIRPHEDERALLLHRSWGGKVFGQLVGGRVVSWAAVKPLSDVVWDLSIETLPGHRGRGYGKSAVSAALRHIFANGRLAGWGCDRDGVASLETAESVGFQYYALDFGCVEVKTSYAPRRDHD
ncbi:MAG: GNAT family N-acetyltransferase [Thermoleophilia bacterium]|nr:GNAT family N-acetyltransferase [Thermoleophilia bacterium]